MSMPRSTRTLLRDVSAPPNLVTLLRVALLPVALRLLGAGMRGAAVAVILAMAATDWLDGHVARSTGRVTELGKILDPAADKIVIDAVLAFLAVRAEFPVWALAIIVTRDVLIVSCAAALAGRHGTVPQSGRLGKVTFAILAATALAYAGDVTALETPLLVAAVALATASGVGYGLRMRGAGRVEPVATDCGESS